MLLHMMRMVSALHTQYDKSLSNLAFSFNLRRYS